MSQPYCTLSLNRDEYTVLLIAWWELAKEETWLEGPFRNAILTSIHKLKPNKEGMAGGKK